MPQVLTVTQLNTIVKELLESEPLLSNICVKGELSNYKIYPSGHHYFTLKDSESSLRCVMFKNSAQRLRFRPDNGLRVTVWGRLGVFPRDGAYQLYCTQIMPEGTGDLQLAFEQLKSKLDKEGLFEATHKKPLPKFPERIAIITSPAGAAIHDIIRILERRWPLAKLIILPVRVQGAEAPAEITQAIYDANAFNIADLIITGRGGGSAEDLWAFNDERVARAVFASHIPVISAVGHEPDVTISDYVADRRASTPSNAAEIAVPDSREIREYLASCEIRISQAMRKKMSSLRDRLENAKNSRVLLNPASQFDNRRLELDHIRERMLSAEERRLSRYRERFAGLAASLDAMSPLRVLGRGYTFATDNDGNCIKHVTELSVGQVFSLNFSDGSANCQVENVLRSK